MEKDMITNVIHVKNVMKDSMNNYSNIFDILDKIDKFPEKHNLSNGNNRKRKCK
jgi:hypothetical protein